MRMSGSVCVIDSQQKPLLPTSAAYARTLVQHRKATLLPHPALPIIQLTHAIPDPVLHPMLLGIALQQRTATILIFTEASGDMPLLSLTLDLAASKVAARRVVALTALARTLGTLLPISQGALVSRLSVTNDPAHASAIHTIMNTLEACLPYSVPLLSHQTPRMASDPLLHAFQQQMDDGHDDTTHLAAVYLPRYQPEPHVSAEVSRAVRLCDNDYHALRPGMIVQTRQQKGVITGIVQEVQQDGAVQVRVPTRATAAGVVWADMGTREHFVTRGKVAIFTLS
jgi:hypothetical protein